MNFEFSADQQDLAAKARRFFEAKCPASTVRAVLEGPQSYDLALWKAIAEMGFLGIAVPECYGGLGLGYLELCVVAEELGRVLAPAPFASSVYLATEFILRAGSESQRNSWLPRLVAGEAIGCFAAVEGRGPLSPKSISARVGNGRLHGTKIAVADGDSADFAVVAARASPAEAPDAISLFLVDLANEGVTRHTVESIDPSRGLARIEFAGAPAEPLGPIGEGAQIISGVVDRAAVLTAFEQIGGAHRALEMARDYALDRMAFGRPIGSFQAIKHLLADMYVSATLARANGYFGAWALSSGSAHLPEAAATARVSATQAFQLCAKNSIQVHGGVGFTWAFDCHLFYRRSNLLALSLGSLSQWEDKLVQRLRERNIAA
jgi:acyl-CoA dehydrogenase